MLRGESGSGRGLPLETHRPRNFCSAGTIAKKKVGRISLSISSLGNSDSCGHLSRKRTLQEFVEFAGKSNLSMSSMHVYDQDVLEKIAQQMCFIFVKTCSPCLSSFSQYFGKSEFNKHRSINSCKNYATFLRKSSILLCLSHSDIDRYIILQMLIYLRGLNKLALR